MTIDVAQGGGGPRERHERTRERCLAHNQPAGEAKNTHTTPRNAQNA
jgi:hypothetical protein